MILPAYLLCHLIVRNPFRRERACFLLFGGIQLLGYRSTYGSLPVLANVAASRVSPSPARRPALYACCRASAITRAKASSSEMCRANTIASSNVKVLSILAAHQCRQPGRGCGRPTWSGGGQH